MPRGFSFRFADPTEAATLATLRVLKRHKAEQDARSRTEAERLAAEEARLTAVDVPIFRGSNRLMQTCIDHETIIRGAADTGKTFACCYRLDTEARRTPKGQLAIVRKVRADFRTTFRRRWEAVCNARGGVVVLGGTNPSEYVYDNGAHVYVLGLDRDSAVLSGEFDFIYVNQPEELTASDWEILSSRVTGRGAVTSTPMLFGDGNPSTPDHWIDARSTPRGDSTDAPALKLLKSRHEDNPDLFAEVIGPDGAVTYEPTAQYDRRVAPLKALTGVRRKRFFLGEAARAEGAVYEFDADVHVVPRVDLPRTLRSIWVFDFGFTNPFCGQLWRVDEDGRLIRTHEIYKTQTLVRDHAKAIARITCGLSREAWDALNDERPEIILSDKQRALFNVAKLRVEAWVCDHDAEGRATLEDGLGIATKAAHKAIKEGIELVSARLREAGDGKPRMVFQRGALDEYDESLEAAHKPCETIAEFDGYVYAKDAEGKPVKEDPVKLNDHGMDATRYLAAYVDGAGKRPAGWGFLALADEAAAAQKAKQ